MVKLMCLAVAAIALSGCGGVSLRYMDDGMYRLKHCDDSHGNYLLCSRLMRQTCPEGYDVLNPLYARSKGVIFMCKGMDE